MSETTIEIYKEMIARFVTFMNKLLKPIRDFNDRILNVKRE